MGPVADILPHTVAGYHALPDEIDPGPLLDALRVAGVVTTYPCVIVPDEPLVFRRWAPGEPLIMGRFGIPEPDPGRPAMRPGLVLVPLLAFDRSGGRLGAGAGFFDRTLTALAPICAIGLAFAEQEVEEVPAEPHDVRLHAVATDREWIEVAV